VDILKAAPSLQSLGVAFPLGDLIARLPGISAKTRGAGSTSLLTRLTTTYAYGTIFPNGLTEMTKTLPELEVLKMGNVAMTSICTLP
jgi:hypothetical protein